MEWTDPFFYTQEFILGGEKWYSETGKEGFVEVCLLWRDGDMGPSCRKWSCIKIYLTDMKELSGFEYSLNCDVLLKVKNRSQ